jgi:hypothetical protein
MDQIVESDMLFGPYPSGHGFRVEDSSPHRAAGEGVKMIEFYKLDLPPGRPAILWLVEAKRTGPMVDPAKYQKSVELLEKRGGVEFREHAAVFDAFVEFIRSQGPRLFPLLPSDVDIYFSELRDKMINGLNLFFATRSGRHPDEEREWPEPFRNVALGKLQVRILLVVKTAELHWLPDLQAELQKVMRPTIGTWALGPDAIVVLNEEEAIRRGFTVAPPT